MNSDMWSDVNKNRHYTVLYKHNYPFC